MTTATGETISIQLNGAPRDVRANATLLDLVDELQLDKELLAVELNGRIVRRAKLGETTLGTGDRVEIVEFVGGG